MNYVYKLEKYKGQSTRYTCPNCGKNKQFTRYVNVDTNQYIDIEVGKCNRVDKCGYHFTPSQYFDSKGKIYIPKSTLIRPNHISENTECSYFKDIELFKKTLNNSHNLFNGLKPYFDNEKLKNAFEMYLVGGMDNYTVFWQIDKEKRIRTGKMILYQPQLPKRTNFINWIHGKMKIPNFILKQCLFGLHLVKEEINKGIAIVESEKTAIIMSMKIPKLYWLACGSLGNFSEKLLHPIKDRKIIAFPDSSEQGKVLGNWKEKANYLNKNGYQIEVSDIADRYTNEQQKSQGFDLADL